MPFADGNGSCMRLNVKPLKVVWHAWYFEKWRSTPRARRQHDAWRGAPAHAGVAYTAYGIIARGVKSIDARKGNNAFKLNNNARAW